MAQRRNVNPRPAFSPEDLPRQIRAARFRARRFVRRSLANLAETAEPILKPLFAINQTSAAIRSLIFVAGFLLWVGYAYVVTPPAVDSIVIEGVEVTDPVSSMLYLFRYMIALLYTLAVPLFVPQVFRFVLVISFAFWLSSRVASIYLADIFDLNDIHVAISFIRQAAFLTLDPRRLNRLVIREGDVANRYVDSPIFQIGGPGLVIVNLENVAIFEKVDGSPHIIPPTGRPVMIEGFERLRKVIDLRDQFIENEEVSSRTKDGIPVRAKGVRFSFSVRRDQTVHVPQEVWEEQGLTQPLSYTDDAILNLVYSKPNEPFDRVGSADVKDEIRRFIGRNSLSQFLADSRDEGAVPDNLPSDPTMPFNPGDTGFKAREYVNQELIWAFKNSSTAPIDLHWVSVGTWVPPPAIPEKHQEAWRRRVKSEADSTPKALTGLFRSTRVKELLRLIQDVPINAFGHNVSREKDPEIIKRELVLAYREKLKVAYDFYRAKDLDPPIHLVAALKHLQRL